jgi:hypothetical protein
MEERTILNGEHETDGTMRPAPQKENYPQSKGEVTKH